MQFTDVFTRADNTDLGANWTPFTGQVAQIVGNEVRPLTPGATAREFYTGTAPNGDQFAQVRIVTFSSAEAEIGVLLRSNTVPAGPQTFYQIYASNKGAGVTTNIDEIVADALTNNASENSTTWVAGDILRVEAQGTNIRVYRNGSLLLSLSGATITSGTFGLVINNDTTAGNAELDDFIGGDLFTPGIIVQKAVARGAFY